MKYSLLLLIFTGILFFILGIQNNLISSITPELIEDFKMETSYINILYAAPYMVAFLLVLFLYHILLKHYSLSFMLYIGAIFFVVSTILFCLSFLFTSTTAIFVVAMCSKLIYGMTLGITSTVLVILLNNRFSLTNVYMANGIWSLIYFFDSLGTIASYVFPPMLFDFSIGAFLVSLLVVACIFLSISILITFYYEKDLKMNLREKNAVPDHSMRSSLLMLIAINSFSIGIYKSLLQLLPELVESTVPNNQPLLGLCIIAGVIFSFIGWMFISKPVHWLLLSFGGILFAILGLVIIWSSSVFTDFSGILPIGLLIYLVGIPFLFSTANMAAVNIYSGDDVRISFIWIIVSTFASIVFFTQLFNFLISFIPYGIPIIYIVCISGLCVSAIFIYKIFYWKLIHIPAKNFNAKALNLINLDLQKYNYSEVDSVVAIDDEFERNNQLEEGLVIPPVQE